MLLPSGEQGRLEVSSHPPGGAPQRLPGRYCLPGLVDAHAHLTVRADHTLGGSALARERLAAYAARGVGLVRDVGGRSTVTLALATAAVPGLPLVRAAGRFLAPNGRYFPGMHDPVSDDDLLAAADTEIAAGATWLKLIGDFPLVDEGRLVPGSLAPTYSPDLVARVIDSARARGARVAVHTQSTYAADLVAAGADSVEHGEWLTEEAVRALGARGGAWTPTLGAVADPEPDASAARRHYAATASERLRILLPLAVRSGVRVLAGTDNATTLPREIALLVEHGLEPAQALAAASTAAADWLVGDAALGTLVTYDADPRQDPDVLNAPVTVVVNGRRVRGPAG